MLWLSLALIATPVVAAVDADDTADAIEAAGPAASAAAAIEHVPPGWKVLHCGEARGVLYVTYADRGQAGITPAVANAAVARACADAGWRIAPRSGRRGGVAAAQPAAATSAPGQRPPAEQNNRSQPGMTAQALGSSLSIDARNDSDIAWRCTVNFSWTSDGDATPRSATAQATLPPRQNNRVADLTGAGRNLRFVGTPSWFCLPNE